MDISKINSDLSSPQGALLIKATEENNLANVQAIVSSHLPESMDLIKCFERALILSIHYEKPGIARLRFEKYSNIYEQNKELLFAFRKMQIGHHLPNPKGKIEIFRAILSHEYALRISPEVVEKLLFQASLRASEEVTDLLLNKFAFSSEALKTALKIAVFWGHEEILERLIPRVPREALGEALAKDFNPRLLSILRS